MPVEIDVGKSLRQKLFHRVCLASGNYVIVSLVLLQHLPHRLDVLSRVTPIPLGVEISKVEFLLLACFDSSHRARDLAGNESLPTTGAFVIEDRKSVVEGQSVDCRE